MKKVILIVFMFVLLCSSAYAVADINRYQLFQGYYYVMDATTSTLKEDKAIFKIDTATGQVWMYYVSLNSTGATYEWIKVGNK
jgi:hypothetical protein